MWVFCLLVPCLQDWSTRGGFVEEPAQTGRGVATYRALVIGITDYPTQSGFSRLETPGNDAKALAHLLSSQFGFTQIQLLLDDQATTENIRYELNQLAEQSIEADSQLIYFAGHGLKGDSSASGYWVPYDAHQGEISSYLDHSNVVRVMKSSKATHVLVIADACFAATLGHSPHDRFGIDYRSLAQKRSRWVITSGAYEPVPDKGAFSQTHSPFAFNLLDILKRTESPYLSTSELLSHLRQTMLDQNAKALPNGGIVTEAIDEKGSFYFWNRKLVDDSGRPFPPPFEAQWEDTQFLLRKLKGKRVWLILGRGDQARIMADLGLIVDDDKGARSPRELKRQIIVRCPDIDIKAVESLAKLLKIDRYKFKTYASEPVFHQPQNCGNRNEITIYN